MGYNAPGLPQKRELVPARSNELLPHEDQLGDVKQIYDRLDGETVRQFRNFCVYRDMGEARSYRMVAEELGLAYVTIRDLAMLNRWVQRAAAYDEYLERVARKELELQRVESRKKHIAVAEKMLDRAMEGLTTIDMTEESVNLKDLAYLADIAVRIERLARGEQNSTKRIEITGDGGGPIQSVNVQAMTPSDRRALLADIQRTVDHRLGQLEATVIEGEVVEDDDE